MAYRSVPQPLGVCDRHPNMTAAGHCHDCLARLCDDCRTFGGFVVRCQRCHAGRVRLDRHVTRATLVFGIMAAALLLGWLLRMSLAPKPLYLASGDECRLK
jgi:hypothetical protein